jgi:hypothetical protein
VCREFKELASDENMWHRLFFTQYYNSLQLDGKPVFSPHIQHKYMDESIYKKYNNNDNSDTTSAAPADAYVPHNFFLPQHPHTSAVQAHTHT